MRKFFAIILMLLLITGPSALLHADEGVDTKPTKEELKSYRLQIGEKAARGVKNVLFGWSEIPKRVVDVTNETQNPIWGVFWGGLEGTAKALIRTASGVVDIITCPIDPEKEPALDPDMG